jgi:hypothetical protein
MGLGGKGDDAGEGLAGADEFDNMMAKHTAVPSKKRQREDKYLDDQERRTNAPAGGYSGGYQGRAPAAGRGGFGAGGRGGARGGSRR